MSKEYRDYDKILEFLEDQHRHDIPVHLLLTHLLHKVNPNFPNPSWSLWPLPKDKVPAPQDIYGDTIDLEADLCPPEGKNDNIEEFPDDIHAQERRDLAFKRRRRKIVIKRKQPEHLKHREHLFNAIHGTVLRSIKKKAKDISALNVDISNEASRMLTMKIYSRLRRVLEALKASSSSQRTWQDVHIANLSSRSRKLLPDMDSYLRSYKNAQKLFSTEYKYEYDSQHYKKGQVLPASDDENDYVETIPQFDVQDHLDAINDTGENESKNAVQKLEEKRRITEQKDTIFNEMIKEAILLHQLSYQNNHAPHYEVENGSYPEERSALLSKPLRKDDFTVNFKR